MFLPSAICRGAVVPLKNRDDTKHETHGTKTEPRNCCDSIHQWSRGVSALQIPKIAIRTKAAKRCQPLGLRNEDPGNAGRETIFGSDSLAFSPRPTDAAKLTHVPVRPICSCPAGMAEPKAAPASHLPCGVTTSNFSTAQKCGVFWKERIRRIPKTSPLAVPAFAIS